MTMTLRGIFARWRAVLQVEGNDKDSICILGCVAHRQKLIGKFSKHQSVSIKSLKQTKLQKTRSPNSSYILIGIKIHSGRVESEAQLPFLRLP